MVYKQHMLRSRISTETVGIPSISLHHIIAGGTAEQPRDDKPRLVAGGY